MIPKLRTVFTVACLFAFTISLGCSGGEVNKNLDKEEAGPVKLPDAKPSDRLSQGPA